MKSTKKLLIGVMGASLLAAAPASAFSVKNSWQSVKKFVIEKKKPIIIGTGVGLIVLGGLTILGITLYRNKRAADLLAPKNAESATSTAAAALPPLPADLANRPMPRPPVATAPADSKGALKYDWSTFGE